MSIVRKNGALVTVGDNKNLQSLLKKRKNRNTFTDEKISKGFQGVFTFDITGSMFGYFDVCRENISEITVEIKNHISLSEFSIGYFRNHGNEFIYEDIFYLTPFLEKEKEITELIWNIKRGGGGLDGRCCMEECLHAANKLPWEARSGKAFVIIADQYPNGVKGVTRPCANGIDWSEEVDKLQEKGVKIYSIFAGNSRSIKDFYQKISDRTDGRLLPITDIHLLTEILVGIAMKETGNLMKYIADRESLGKISQEEKRTLLLLE